CRLCPARGSRGQGGGERAALAVKDAPFSPASPLSPFPSGLLRVRSRAKGEAQERNGETHLAKGESPACGRLASLAVRPQAPDTGAPGAMGLLNCWEQPGRLQSWVCALAALFFSPAMAEAVLEYGFAEAERAAIACLFSDYEAAIGVSLCFQNFAAEV